jgi:hypothetical protein
LGAGVAPARDRSGSFVSVRVSHLEDLLPRMLADLLRVIGRDMRLNVLDQLVVRFAFNIYTRTMNNLHGSSFDGLQRSKRQAFLPGAGVLNP